MPVSQNLAGDYLKTAMFEAQELGLKRIVGSTLLSALKAHETASDWAKYPAYAELKEQCQFYLVYKTIQEVLPKVAFKICNTGAVQTSDQNVQNLTREQIDAMIEDYSSKADSFAYQLQAWLSRALEGEAGYLTYFITADREQFCDANGAKFCVYGEPLVFPEEAKSEIRMNLYSAASCGIWLGGARGQI